MPRRRALPVLLVTLLLGCGGDGDADPDAGLHDAGVLGAEARFALGAEPLEWSSVPFPNDLHRNADGSLRLPAFPSSVPMWESVRERLEQRNGFCTTCGLWFPIDGQLDRSSLPADAGPGDEASAADPIVLLDTVDGSFIPLRHEWNETDGIIALELKRGTVLARERLYVAALTSDLRGADGEPLRASAAFVALRDEASGGGAPVEDAREVVRPALDALVGAGVERSRIVSIAPFTTGDPTTDLLAVQDIVNGLPAPSVVEIDQIWHREDGTLEELCGTPVDGLPAGRPPATEGVEGENAFSHASTLMIVSGHFLAPRVVEREGAVPGYPRRGPDGSLRAGEMHEVPFLLTIPNVAERGSLPMVIYHPGGGGNRLAAVGVQETAGRIGAAAISIDPFLHGSRAADAFDDPDQTLRDDGEPDGFLDPPGGPPSVVLSEAGFLGAEEGRTGSPLYSTGSFLQLAADALSLVRLIREGDWSAAHDAHADLAGLGFSPEKVAWTGVSQGGMVGAILLALDSHLATVSGTPHSGHMVDIFALGPGIREALDVFGFFHAIGIRTRFDGVERRLSFHPLWTLFEWAVEPGDPLTFAPYYVANRLVPGAPPDVLLQYAGHDEFAGMIATGKVLGASGIPGVGTYDYVEVPAIGAPVSANFDTPDGAITAVAWMFPEATHSFGFLYEDEFGWEAPLDVPFVARESPHPVDNPVLDIHRQLSHFIRTRFEDGRGVVCDPADDCPPW